MDVTQNETGHKLDYGLIDGFRLRTRENQTQENGLVIHFGSTTSTQKKLINLADTY